MIKFVKVFSLFFLFVLFVYQNPVLCVDIDPQRIEITLPAGSEKILTFKLANRENMAVKFDSHVGFYRFLFTGNSIPPENKSPEDILKSCESWINIENPSFTIQKDEEYLLNFKVVIPQNANGEYAACIVLDRDWAVDNKAISEVENDNNDLQIDMNFVSRRAIPVYIFIDGTTEINAVIKNVTIDNYYSQDETKSVRGIENRIEIAAVLENTGTKHIRAKGSVMIFDEAGNTVENISTGITLPIFPEFGEIIPVYWKYPKKRADYTAIITLDLGEEKIIQTETNFSINEKGFLIK